MKNICRTALILILTFLSITTMVVYSATDRDFSAMQNCRYIFSECNSDSAFVYGYNINILYTAKIFPTGKIFCEQTNGKIRSVCNDGQDVYALVNMTDGNYSVLKLSLSNGDCNYYDFGSMKLIDNDYFAVSNNKAYFVQTDISHSYIASYELDGKRLKDYRFNSEFINLFTNDSTVYVRLYNGDIYKLNDSGYEFCVKVDPDYEVTNAGAGWIYSEEGLLISLKGRGTEAVSDSNAKYVVENNEIYYASEDTVYSDNGQYVTDSEISMLLVCNGKTAILTDDFICTTIDKSDFTTELVYSDKRKRTEISDDYISGIESGTTVRQFKDSTGVIAVYDSEGNPITSGRIKTGYSAYLDGNIKYLSVRGDITGEGNVNSKDVTALMSYFTEKSQLDNLQRKSADYNLDGTVSNKDLVLISRK